MEKKEDCSRTIFSWLWHLGAWASFSCLSRKLYNSFINLGFIVLKYPEEAGEYDEKQSSNMSYWAYGV